MNAKITCKHCGASIPLCGHIAGDLAMLEGVREKLRASEAKVEGLLAAIQTATVGNCLSPDRVTKYRACLICRRDLNVCDRDYRVCIETDALDRACSGAKVRALVSESA